MNKEKQTLEDSFRSMKERRELAEKALWESESSVAKKLDEVEQSIKYYNTLAAKLHLTPVSSKNAEGKNLDITLNTHAQSVNEMVPANIKGEIQPTLLSIKSKYEKIAVQADEELISFQDILDQKEESLAEKKEEIRNMEAKLKQLQDQYKANKARLLDQLQLNENERETLRKEIEQYKLQASATYNKSQKLLESLNTEYDQLQKRYSHEKASLNNTLLLLLEALMNHKTYVQESLEKMKHHCINVFNQVQSSSF